MTIKRTPAMLRAIELVKAGANATEASRAVQVHVRALRRALREEQIGPLARGRPRKAD